MSYTPAQMQCLTAHRADYLKREIIKELHEPCAVKVACTVLEGESGGNPADLLRYQSLRANCYHKIRLYHYATKNNRTQGRTEDPAGFL